MSTMHYKSSRYVDVPGNDLLTWIFENGDKHDPDQPVYVDALNPSRSITVPQARSAIRSMIKGLRSLGVRHGDCVCLHSFNIYYPLIFLAVIGAGGVFLGSNPGYKEFELTGLFESSNPALVISAPELLPTVQNVAKQLSIPDSNLLVFDELNSTASTNIKSWHELFAHGEEDWYRFNSVETAKATSACLVTTSGTTGMPKLAVLSHYSWVAFNSVVDDPVPKPYDIRRLIFLPMFHTFAAPLSNLAPLREGHTTYIMPRFSMSRFVEIVEQCDINEVLLVPPMIVSFVTGTAPRDFLKHIRFVWCGGAPLESAVVKKMYRLLAPDACIAQVYGMTEAGWISTLKWPERDESGSVGRLLANVEAKLVNNRGIFIRDPGKRGEICVRGPRLMSGYLGNKRATADSFVEGWLKTGDVGTFDSNGRIFVVDRQKDLIKVRGWQVSPAELEGVLRTHPDIEDAAVIGVKYKNSEAPKALVIRKNDSISEEGVRDFIAGLLVGYKHLDGGVSFVDTIPKSPSGKILRKLL